MKLFVFLNRAGIALLLTSAVLCGNGAHATAEPLRDPRIVSSSGTTLPLTLTARNGSVMLPGVGQIDGLYLYSAGSDAASLAPATLQLRPGQSLRLTLKNRLTCGLSAGEGRSPPDQTNIHTHGLLVSPHDKDARGKYGDFVYYTLQSEASGCVPATMPTMDAHMMPSESGQASYDIHVPTDHPSGLYWYHPHVHSISGAQVGGGMSGLITIGQLWDYAHVRCALNGSGPSRCVSAAARTKERAAEAATDEHYLMLKDVQLVKGSQAARWTYNAQFDPGLCDTSPPASSTSEHRGYCDSPDGTKRWLYTVNGQHLPTIRIATGRAAVLRIANVSANVTHILRLRLDTPDGRKLLVPFQVLAVDGIAKSTATKGPATSRNVLMMPASRAELYLSSVTICKALAREGAADLCQQTLRATLEQKGLKTGPDADTWPQMDLATIELSTAGAQAEPVLNVAPVVSDAVPVTMAASAEVAARATASPGLSTVAAPARLCDDQSAATTIDSSRGDYRLIALRNGVCINGATAGCDPNDPGATEQFGMVTELRQGWSGASADALPTRPYEAFDHHRVDLCVGAPIASGAYFEDWVVSNQASEIHNFHVHQAKFEVLETSPGSAPNVIGVRPTQNALHDTYPIDPGGWIRLRMRFTHSEQVGRYVYHCHILEHEDKGMMSVIQVVDTSVH